MGTNNGVWKIYYIANRMIHLAYLNLLWLLFTLLGLIAFGIFPSTVALFSVLRKWVKGEHDIPLFSNMIKVYKKEFFRSNLLGFIIVILGLILWVDFQFLMKINDEFLLFLITIPLVCILALYIILVICIVPTFVHYKLSIFGYLKHALVIGISNPLRILTIIFCIYILYMLTVLINGMILFYTFSLSSYLTMRILYSYFSEVDNKRAAISG